MTGETARKEEADHHQGHEENRQTPGVLFPQPEQPSDFSFSGRTRRLCIRNILALGGRKDMHAVFSS